MRTLLPTSTSRSSLSSLLWPRLHIFSMGTAREPIKFSTTSPSTSSQPRTICLGPSCNDRFFRRFFVKMHLRLHRTEHWQTGTAEQTANLRNQLCRPPCSIKMYQTVCFGLGQPRHPNTTGTRVAPLEREWAPSLGSSSIARAYNSLMCLFDFAMSDDAICTIDVHIYIYII